MSEDPARNRLRTMLGELLDHMEGAQEVASGIAQEYPEYEAMAEAVGNPNNMVAMACELEVYGGRESDDQQKLALGGQYSQLLKQPVQVQLDEQRAEYKREKKEKRAEVSSRGSPDPQSK